MEYETIIIGASFLGLGAAMGLENCAVIERGGLFGAEFVNSYKVSLPGQIIVKTKPGIAFLKDLRARGLVDEEGEIYQAPAVYVLSRFLKEKPVNIRLMTEIINLEKQGNWYQLTLYHSRGFERIRAKRVIDTGVPGWTPGRSLPTGSEKFLNAIIVNPGGNSMAGLSRNQISGLWTYSLPAALYMERHEAVEKLCALEHTFQKNNMRIASIAPEFAYTLDPAAEEIDAGFWWRPSAAWANLISAFDEGAALAERMDP
jgi:hypothetical protein